MATRYAYSFDRNTFFGSFATRQEAYYAGLTRLNSLTDQPEAIYVAERIQPDLQVTGHASGIIREMRKRADIASGDAAAGWLVNVTGQQVADLDEMLGQTIFAWLRKHELQPKFFSVEHISETAPLAEPKKATAPTKEELNAANCSC